MTERSDEFWEVAIAVNAAFKGLLGSMGESGHICARTMAVETTLDLSAGWETVSASVVGAAAGHVESGDVIVLADKIAAVSLGRVRDGAFLREPDPKTIDQAGRVSLASALEAESLFPISALHLLIADEYDDGQAAMGTDEPNKRAAELARSFQQVLGIDVDVVISDTDTGLDVRSPLIGTLTIGATPLGATAGLNLYEAMRCAVAAEFVRGHSRMIPAVICKPAMRRRVRPQMGLPRTYPGFLHIDNEKGLAHA